MVDSVLEFFRRLDLPVAEQVIDVPMISSSSSCPSRAPLSEPLMVEQLVEVPTIISFSSLQRSGVDIPVPGGGGPSSGLHGFFPRQRSTASPSSTERSSERIVEQIVDHSSVERISERIVETSAFPSSKKRSSERILEQITVPSSEERSSQRIVQQLFDISSGGLSPGVFSASSAGAADEGPAGRGSGMSKARFAGEVALRALSSRVKAGFAGEDAPRGSSSRGKAGSAGDDAPLGSSSLPRACELRLGGLPAHGRHDEWVCVVDVENDGEYFWNRLDNSSCWRLPTGVKHRWCLLSSGLYRDVALQVDYRVLPPL